MQCLSEGENLSLGGVTAFVVGMTVQPTLYWKNAAQQGMPFTLNPRVIYRGLGAALSAEIGQMALQFMLTGVIQRAVVGKDTHRELSNTEEISAALLGGALSAFYTAPVELTMVQQQNFGGSMLGTTMRIMNTYGVWKGLSRGFMATASRDAIYTAGLLGITPILQAKLIKDYRMGSSTAGVIASCIAGVVAGSLSCPVDAVKTCMQGDIGAVSYQGFVSTLGKLRQEGRLFGGVGWRVANITGTIMIANELKVRLAPYMFPTKFVAVDASSGYQ